MLTERDYSFPSSLEAVIDWLPPIPEEDFVDWDELDPEEEYPDEF